MGNRSIRPGFSSEEAERIAAESFSVSGKAGELPGYNDQNFLISDGAGRRYVLKMAHRETSADSLKIQNQVLEGIADNCEGIGCPRLYRTQSGETMVRVEDSMGYFYWVRLFSYLEGIPLAEIQPHPPELLQELGRFTARLAGIFQPFSSLEIQSDPAWDLRNGFETVRRYQGHIRSEDRKCLLQEILGRLEEEKELLSLLPFSLVHNDGNDYNLLVAWKDRSPASLGTMYFSGILDFGDMARSYAIADLAVALTYALFRKENVLEAAGHVVSGYNSLRPLAEEELRALFPLILLRLAISVCLSACRMESEPENPYLGISQKPAWDLLQKMHAIPTALFYYSLRRSCGRPAVPSAAAVAAWIGENNDRFFPVFGFPLERERITVFDLGPGSPLWETAEEWTDMDHVVRRLQEEMDKKKGAVGVGRYDQARLFYTTPSFRSNDPSQSRTIHIGIDLHADPGQEVFAPLEGVIHSCRDNRADRDYGPTVILAHDPAPGVRFFTLYGHLSRESLLGLHPGQTVRRGERIGSLGSRMENGGWPPHLHFQIVLDMLGWEGDFPGVASAADRELWLGLCPDPNGILHIPQELLTDGDLPPERLLALRHVHIGKSLSLSYRSPLKIVRGYRQYLYDWQGRIFLDAVNNVPHVGHSHPTVVQAIRRQAATLNTNTRYLHDNLLRYTLQLLETLPHTLQVCFFVNSGSEANDLALRLAGTCTKERDIIVLDGAYHGNLSSLVNISPYKFDGPGGSGCPEYVHKLPRPDPFRGFYRDDPQCREKYALHMARALEDIRRQGRRPAAFIVESLMGCGGQIVFPRGYLQSTFRLVRLAGGLCISDEVQTGFGRCGDYFWGFESQGVVPDIVTLGKPMGNGYPIGAVITTRAVADAFANGMEYFNTYGGGPVACAAGMAVLQVIRAEGLQENARDVGHYLMEGLLALSKEFTLIGEVRGLGLFLGVELVLDRETRRPAAAHAAYVVERMCREGVLLSTDGPDHNVLKIKPPLVFTRSDADFLLAKMGQILQESPLALHSSG